MVSLMPSTGTRHRIPLAGLALGDSSGRSGGCLIPEVIPIGGVTTMTAIEMGTTGSETIIVDLSITMAGAGHFPSRLMMTTTHRVASIMKTMRPFLIAGAKHSISTSTADVQTSGSPRVPLGTSKPSATLLVWRGLRPHLAGRGSSIVHQPLSTRHEKRVARVK